MRGRRLVALGIVVCAACGGEGAGGDAAPETAASWDLELLHEIGSIDEPDDALTDVGEVRLHPDGALFIEQPDDENIRMYAPDATFMGTIGTRGEGPEEIARLATFGLHGDTVWVHDARGLAIHRYLRDGTFLERVRWSPEQLPGEGRIRYMLRTNRGMHLYRDGTSLVEPAALVPIEMGAGGEPRPGPDPILPIVRVGLDGVVSDTIAWRWYESDPDYPPFAASLFQSNHLSAVQPDGSGFVMAFRHVSGNSEPGTFRVLRVSAVGDTAFDRTFGYERLDVPGDVAAEFEAEFRELQTQNPGRWSNGMWIPESVPPVSALVPTTDGLVWVGREETREPSLWWGLDSATGDHVATVTLEAGEEIAEQHGDVLITTRTDDLDVPYVRRWRVRR